MPEINGKEYPYTPEGVARAKKALMKRHNLMAQDNDRYVDTQRASDEFNDCIRL